MTDFRDKLIKLIIEELRDHIGQGCKDCDQLSICEEHDCICFEEIEAILRREK